MGKLDAVVGNYETTIFGLQKEGAIQAIVTAKKEQKQHHFTTLPFGIQLYLQRNNTWIIIYLQMNV